MITLYTFGPKFGLPDPSPFCMKAMALLKMAGLDYHTADCDPRKAPKGKGPWLDDNGTPVPDTTFIRWHLEEKYNIDFDAGLSAEQKATAWAYEKMCEAHTYWTVLTERWGDETNFNKGPRRFFDPIPAVLRPIVVTMVRRQILRDLRGQGMGRHTRDEQSRLARADFDALATYLGDKPYFMGEQPTGIDATLHGFVASVACDYFDTQSRRDMAGHANLMAYRDRTMALWYPDFDPAQHQ